MPHGSPFFLLNRFSLYQVAIHCCLISASWSSIDTLSFFLNFLAITYTPGHLSSLALLPSPSSPSATQPSSLFLQLAEFLLALPRSSSLNVTFSIPLSPGLEMTKRDLISTCLSLHQNLTLLLLFKTENP